MRDVDRPPNELSEDRQLALLVAGARDYAIFLLDPQGHVMTWNAGAAAMKGYTHGEIAGRMGVPLGTAKAWTRRGLAALRGCMG